MTYKYQHIMDRNEAALAPLNLPERFKKSFALELTHKEALKYSAQEQEAHGNSEKARNYYEISESRTPFMLGMVDTLRALDMIDDETNNKLVNMAYGRTL